MTNELQHMKDRRIELYKKIDLFSSSPRHMDLVAKFKKELAEIEEFLEISEKATSVLSELPDEPAQVSDATLRKLYDEVIQAIDDANFLKERGQQYKNHFGTVQDKLSQIKERENIYRKAFPEANLDELRPAEMSKFMKMYETLEADMKAKALEAKKLSTTLSDTEESGLSYDSLDMALEMMNLVGGEEQ